MATIHWLNEAGVEAQPVCSVDFADEGLAIAFAHDLYRSVHAYGRSKLGFAIKNEQDRPFYSWRWDDPSTGVSGPIARDGVDAIGPEATKGTDDNQCSHDAYPLEASHEAKDSLKAKAGTISRRVAKVVTRRFAPEVPPKVRRWRPEIDHYLLAIIAVLAILCGSPLCSIYATVQHLLRDESFLHQERSTVARATRDATATVLATHGKLDFRKLFWHLRVVGPTEIHLLAYEPDDDTGPRLIFETKDLLHWRLRKVRGADGTWWT